MKQISKVVLFFLFLVLVYYEYTLLKDLQVVYKEIKYEKEKVLEEIELKYKERDRKFYMEG